jgi:hypothetical protein
MAATQPDAGRMGRHRAFLSFAPVVDIKGQALFGLPLEKTIIVIDYTH